MTIYDWHITQLTPEAAMKHTRRTMNIPDDVGLGWTPYNYLVTHKAVSQWACHNEKELERWMSVNKFELLPWTAWENGVRSTWLKKKEGV
jgi:hypothetical protein